MRLARIIPGLLLVAACGGEATPDASTTTTTGDTATTTTLAPATTTLATTTTVADTTTTTLGTGPLFDSFDSPDGPTTATPYFGEGFMSFDTSVFGVVTIAATSHDSPGVGSRLFATYPHLFRDGTMFMVFTGAADGSAYYFFLRSAVDFSYYTEVAMWPSLDGTTDMVYVTVVPGDSATPLSVPPGTYDPVGPNTLRIDVFDGTISVFLNGVSLGQVIDPAGAIEGVFGFGIIAFDEGAQMTVDDFLATPETS